MASINGCRWGNKKAIFVANWVSIESWLRLDSLNVVRMLSRQHSTFTVNFRFLYNHLFNLYLSEKIFLGRSEILPLGVIFGVNHEPEIIFLIRGRKANRAIKISQKFALFWELNSVHMEMSKSGSKLFL